MHVMCLPLRYIGVRAAAGDREDLCGVTAEGTPAEVNPLSLSGFKSWFIFVRFEENNEVFFPKN